MDTHDSSSFFHDVIPKAVSSLKSGMTLDFGSDRSKTKKLANMLNSPDINMLKLASPELERLIVQQGIISTTPTTPGTKQILFPKTVSEEQEAYVRGFVDALAELHQKPEKRSDDEDEDDSINSDSSDMKQPMPTYTMLQTASAAATVPSNQTMPPNAISFANANRSTYSTVSSLPVSVSTMTTSNIKERTIGSGSLPYPTAQHIQLMHMKEEPQRVPSLSPHLTPIDMGQQETVKLERKRARNRVAAYKCRTRKLERIQRLEDRVDELKGQNTTLVDTASELREQVFTLKQHILEHVNSGCKVMLAANVL